MSDLISRKAVIDYLNEQIKEISETNPDGIYTKSVLRAMKSTGMAVRSRVATLPTAYDVDKVLAKTEEYATNVDSDCDDVIYSVIDDLMLIVKGDTQ